MDPSAFRMERDDSMKFDKVETSQLKDVTHLWKQEGDRVILRTEEEYQADMKREREEFMRKEREAKKETKIGKK